MGEELKEERKKELKEALDEPKELRGDSPELLDDVRGLIDKFWDEPFTLSNRQIYYNLVDKWWKKCRKIMGSKRLKTPAKARLSFLSPNHAPFMPASMYTENL